jgi:hypothetical protein
MITLPSSDNSFTSFVLAQIRVATARSRLMTCELDAIGVALSGGFVGADLAAAWLNDIGVDLVATSSAIATVTSS